MILYTIHRESSGVGVRYKSRNKSRSVSDGRFSKISVMDPGYTVGAGVSWV